MLDRRYDGGTFVNAGNLDINGLGCGFGGADTVGQLGSAVGEIIQLDRNRDDPVRVGVCRREHQAIQSVI